MSDSEESPLDLPASPLLDPVADGAQHLDHLPCSELCMSYILPCLVLPANPDSMGVPRKLEWEGAVEGGHTQGACLPVLLSTTIALYYNILKLYPTFPPC